MELGNFDEETEVAITHAKSKLPLEDCKYIVGLVRKVREAKSNKLTPTVRACIVIGKIVSLRRHRILVNNHTLRQTCLDVLMPEVPGEERGKVAQVIDEAIGACFQAEVKYG
jgi:nitric oxide reductase NorQ protein